jgi:hypothetical protein
MALSPVFKPSQLFSRSGQYSIATTEKEEETPLYSARLDVFGYPFPKLMDVGIWALKRENQPTGASLNYTLTRGNEILFGDEQPLDGFIKNQDTWSKVKKTFIIPDVFDSTLQINIFIKNPKRAHLFADDLEIRYHYGWE